MKTVAVTALCLMIATVGLYAQTAGTLSGTVRDAGGGVIPGAEVTVVEEATGTTKSAITGEDGSYFIPSVNAGSYTISVEVTGFKKIVIRNVRVAVGISTTQDVSLQMGELSDSVIVEARQGLIERREASVTSIIEGRQITELPFTSRDTLDLALTQAGTSTPGTARSSTVNGLPKGALNISMDGIRIQSHFLRSSDGFFAYIRPRIDTVGEFSMTQAGQSAESAGEGAVQINFVTKRGTNQYHGGAWWYHRNPVLNSNYYFNNVAGVERERQLLNQIGFKVGGPVLQDKLFFFFTIDSFRLPESRSQQRTVFAPEALDGLFTYNRIDAPGETNTVDVLALARENGFRSEIDPVNMSFLNLIQGTLSNPGVGEVPSTNPLTRQIRFNNSTSEERYFPTLRLDWTINDKWRWEGIWNYNYFNADPDLLNGRGERFPGLEQAGSQLSHRFSLSSAVHTSIGHNMANEFRMGTVGGTLLFAPELGAQSDFYPTLTVGGERVNYQPGFPLVSSPLHGEGDQRRNTPLWQFQDNFTWTKGNHTFTFGGQFSDYKLWLSSIGGALPDVGFGVTSTDPAFGLFNEDTFPGANNATLGNARAFYALLTGRVTSFASSTFVGDGGEDFQLLAPDVDRLQQQELGLFFQDQWRVSPTVTLNLGLRWQYESPVDEFRNNKFSVATDGFGGIFGESGAFNLFQPGHMPGNPTVFVRGDGDSLYEADTNNWAPNIGLAWNPTFDNGWLKTIFGSNPVFRGGYSVSYVQEGLNVGLNVAGTGPGYVGTAQLDVDEDFTPGTLFASDGLPSPVLVPPRAFDFPLELSSRFRDFSYDEFVPDLESGYVQSWSLGIQREISDSTVLEIRYVGNKGVKLWQQVNIDEVNVFENGFLDEFRLAQQNLDISLANGGGSNFANQGLAGQVPLPIMESVLFSSDFRLATFVNLVNEGRVGDMAGIMATNFARFNRGLENGLPLNFFLANPLCVSCGYLGNSGWSEYNSLQIEMRRRMSQGLLLQANYTWSNAYSNVQSVASNVFSGPATLRDFNFAFGPSPFQVQHAFKANWIYELPFGTGRRWAASNSVLNKLMEGWEFAGILRWQSGRGFGFDQGGRGTFNAGDGGIDFGLSREEIQGQVDVRRTGDGRVFFLPEGFVGDDGRANTDIFGQHTEPGTFGDFLFFEGPQFIRTDLTVSKKTYINEDLNVEFRAEFLNAFNNVNFLVGGGAGGAGNQSGSIRSTAFGRVQNAFRDVSTTNDLGGRMIQLVLRINF